MSFKTVYKVEVYSDTNVSIYKCKSLDYLESTRLFESIRYKGSVELVQYTMGGIQNGILIGGNRKVINKK